MTKVVTLPLTPTDMVEFFKDKSIVYTVDLDATTLNEKSMLVYLANLGINCEFTEVNDNLILEYITLKNVTNITMLKMIHANILYYSKYNEILYPFVLEIFDEERMLAFVQSNTEIIAEQLMFLDSMMLYMLTRSVSEGEKQKLTTNIDEGIHDEIGFSVIQLLDFHDFLICYSVDIPELNEQTYYTRYFDEYMFQGKNLFQYAAKGAFFGLIAKISSAFSNEEDRTDLENLDNCMIATLNEAST